MESLKKDNAINSKTDIRHSSPTMTRRHLLQIMNGLGLSVLLPQMNTQAAEKRGKERPKSLIVLWLDGGPSQLETWDPHAGTAIGGETGAIDTTIPGVQIADLYPQMAEQIGNLSIIRSLTSKEGDHERARYYVKTGYRPDPTTQHPALGAILVHQTGDKSIEIPQFVSLGNSSQFSQGGYLGAEFDAFKVFEPGRNVSNMRPRVGKPERQSRRLKNLSILSSTFEKKRKASAEQTLHGTMIERALLMMNSEQLKAFEIDDEPQNVSDGYGDNTFGRGCLVARRLIEQGVRAVEVTLGGFDSHVNNFETQKARAQTLDSAFSQLVKDLKQRDLLDSTIVLCMGEFGRTPRINPLAGRDHWPQGFSCVVGGGGLQSGVVIGATDPTGEKKDPTDPVKVHDLYATILKLMDVEYEKELITPIGRPLALCQGTPLEKLVAPIG